MNYLTNYYKNLSEQLQYKVNRLQKLIEAQNIDIPYPTPFNVSPLLPENPYGKPPVAVPYDEDGGGFRNRPRRPHPIPDDTGPSWPPSSRDDWYNDPNTPPADPGEFWDDNGDGVADPIPGSPEDPEPSRRRDETTEEYRARRAAWQARRDAYRQWRSWKNEYERYKKVNKHRFQTPQ